MRITMLSPRFWPEVVRGTERAVHSLSHELLRRGHEVTLITSHASRRPSQRVEDGLTVIRVPRLPESRWERRMHEHHMGHLPFEYLALRRVGGDVVHAWFQTDATVAARWRRRTGTPAVFSYMGIPDHAGVTFRRRRLEITLEALRGVDAVVGLSRFVADEFDRWLGVEARTIYPPTDVEVFRPAPGLRAKEPTIFCAASADEKRKRVPLLVEAFAAVRREHPSARLVLLRPTVPGLEAALSGPGVEWVDPRPDPEWLAGLYAEAWVSSLPSRADSFGIVLAESLACGTPVVVSDHGAPKEIVDRPGVGRVFEGDSPDALAAALLEAIELARDPETAAACRARGEDFSSGRCADAYEELYAELLRR